MSIHFGTQNTNCLTYIPNDINLSLDPLNVTVTGSPTISSGVVSNFSSANYITTTKNFTPGSSTWEWMLKINMSQVTGTQFMFGGKNHEIPLIGIVGSKFKLYLSSNGTSWNITNGTVGTHTLTVNTDYWVKLRFTGSAYILSYSTDGSTFTDDITVSSTATQVGGYPLIMGYGWTDNPTTKGTVDLTACYIKVGSSTIWKGGSGRLTVKKGSKVYIPNGYTSYKYYKATYGSWTRPNLTSNTSNSSFTLVDPKLSGGTLSGTTMTWGTAAVTRFTDVWKSFDNSTSTYFRINNGNQTFTVFDIIFSDYMSVTGVTINGKVVSSAASSLTGSQIYALKDNGSYALLSTKTDKDVNTHTFAATRTRRLRICARPNTDGGSYPSRLTDITITAQKQTGGTESTSSDYDYKVGSGSMIFDEVVIASDKILTHQWGTINDSMFLYYRNNNALERLSVQRSISGSTDTYTGSYSRIWYNTNENKIKWVNADGTITDTLLMSLPLCKFTAEGYNSSAVKSIDQTFNGFGFIGSTVYGLKGVKRLSPNGMNPNGTYNSTEDTITSVMIKTFTSASSNVDFILQNGNMYNGSNVKRVNNISDIPSTGKGNYYVINTNQMIWADNGKNTVVGRRIVAGKVTTESGGRITSFTLNPVQPTKITRKIKKVYLGTKNTNCLTHIPQDINLSLDPLNVTVTGSPTISSGVVSNFSSANYITTTKNFTPGSSTWEYVQKIKFSNVSAHEHFIGCKNQNFPLVKLYNSKFMMYVSSNGSSWNVASEKAGTFVPTANTYYWIKLRFTGSAYILSYSTDGSSFTDDITVSSTATIKGGSNIVIGHPWSDRPFTTGTVDLTACYIKVGNSIIWQGGFGRCTTKKGSIVTFPYGVEDLSSTYPVGSTFLNSKFKVVNTSWDGSKFFVQAEVTSDIVTYTGLTTDTNIRLAAIRTNGGHDILYTTESGTGYTGTGTVMYYDTAKNLVERYSSGTLQSYNLSLPIARAKANGSVYFSSIDQVFNGFGYIGSYRFRLPKIKFLASDGFNPNGTYKSTEIETDDVLLTEVTATGTYTWYHLLTKTAWFANTDYYEQTTAPTVTTNAYWYNPNENKLYRWNGSSWVSYLGVIMGKSTVSATKVTSLTPNKVQPEYTGREITRIYKGSTLVYGYKPNKVMLEKSTAGTYTLNLEHSGDYEVTIVGGGGGGAYNVSTKFSDGVISGGSGAGFKGIIHLKAGTHTVKVGAGGTSVNPGNASTAMPKVGSSSSIGSIITAGCANADGTANAGFNGSGNVISKGGVLTYDKSAVRSYTIASNGNDGLQGWNTSVEGASSVISGTTYGAGDIGKNGAMSKGQDGYVKIVAV